MNARCWCAWWLSNVLRSRRVHASGRLWTRWKQVRGRWSLLCGLLWHHSCRSVDSGRRLRRRWIVMVRCHWHMSSGCRRCLNLLNRRLDWHHSRSRRRSGQCRRRLIIQEKRHGWRLVKVIYIISVRTCSSRVMRADLGVRRRHWLINGRNTRLS